MMGDNDVALISEGESVRVDEVLPSLPQIRR